MPRQTMPPQSIPKLAERDIPEPYGNPVMFLGCEAASKLPKYEAAKWRNVPRGTFCDDGSVCTDVY
jgi:hypothetical protein